MSLKTMIAAAMLLVLAACATPVSGPGPQAPTGSGGIPSSRIDLGDYRRAAANQVASRFSDGVTRRYAQGMMLSQVSADLRSNQFQCQAGGASDRGNPPAHVCRRVEREGGCEHTWQVHLFAEGQTLARTRAIYDRTCGDDGLLGG